MARLSFLVACLALGGAASGSAGPQTLEWKHGAPLPVPRSEVAASTVGHELVIAGGFLADGRSSKRVDGYSPARNRWRRLPDLPVAVNHAMAASDGRRLYVTGGYGAPTRAFVLVNGRWRRLPDLPEPRAAAGAAIVGRLPDLPTPRHGLGVVALAGRVYVVAGGPTPGLSVSVANEFLQLR